MLDDPSKSVPIYIVRKRFDSGSRCNLLDRCSYFTGDCKWFSIRSINFAAMFRTLRSQSHKQLHQNRQEGDRTRLNRSTVHKIQSWWLVEATMLDPLLRTSIYATYMISFSCTFTDHKYDSQEEARGGGGEWSHCTARKPKYCFVIQENIPATQ